MCSFYFTEYIAYLSLLNYASSNLVEGNTTYSGSVYADHDSRYGSSNVVEGDTIYNEFVRVH